MMLYFVLYYIILYYIILYYIILYYIILYYIILYYIILYYIILYYIILYYIILYYIILYYIILYYIILYYFISYYIILYYIILYFTALLSGCIPCFFLAGRTCMVPGSRGSRILWSCGPAGKGAVPSPVARTPTILYKNRTSLPGRLWILICLCSASVWGYPSPLLFLTCSFQALFRTPRLHIANRPLGLRATCVITPTCC